MSFELDPQIQQIMSGFADSGLSGSAPQRQDVASLRARAVQFNAATEALMDSYSDVFRTDYQIAVEGGSVLARWYTRNTAAPGPAVVYFHGGAMVAGSLDQFDRYAARHTAESGVPLLSVDYRLAPESPAPTQALDGIAALDWLVKNAAELNVDPQRIAVMGDSAGGGVAAAVAIGARRANVAIARQILIYPMLDDRAKTPEPGLRPLVGTAYEDIAMCWRQAIANHDRETDIDSLCAPARETDMSGLAPAFIDVAEVDIFRDEGIEYARRLAAAGVSVEMYVRRGCPHGFDRFPVSVAERSWSDRVRAISGL